MVALITDTTERSSIVYPLPTVFNPTHVWLLIKRTPNCIVYRVFSEQPDPIVLKCAAHEEMDLIKIGVDVYDSQELEGFN